MPMVASMMPNVAWPVPAPGPHVAQYLHGFALAHAAAHAAATRVANSKAHERPGGSVSVDHSSMYAGVPFPGLPAADFPGKMLQTAANALEKKLRRKESNRESARRSRLRKQAETVDLGVKVKELKAENAKLREEIKKLQKKLKVPSD